VNYTFQGVGKDDGEYKLSGLSSFGSDLTLLLGCVAAIEHCNPMSY